MRKDRQFAVVLCEDETHYNFVYRFLECMGLVKARWQVNPVFTQTGSGEQFVRENLPAELKACRNQNKAGRFALLIVVIDADNLTVNERKQQLQQRCESNVLTRKEGYIRNEEPVAVLIPKRNIETWLELLDGQPVDESTNYKKPGKRTSRCESQVRTLLAHCQQQTLPEHMIASLQAACDEYHRILPRLMQH